MRKWTPDSRDPATGITTVKVKRVCNGCGTKIGDVTEEEMSAVMADRPLPDVREECQVCSVTFGISVARPIRGDEPEPQGPETRGVLIGERRPSDILDGDFGVYLPHSCDEWIIASGDKRQALTEARRFRDELDEAIRTLEGL